MSYVTILKGAFKNRVSEVAVYLDHSIADVVRNYMLDTYDWSPSDLDALDHFYVPSDNLTKKAFAHEATAKKLVKLFEENFANNGSDSVVYTARCIGENGCMEEKHIKGILPELDRWVTPLMLKHIDQYHENQSDHDLQELNRLAKKLGKKIS